MVADGQCESEYLDAVLGRDLFRALDGIKNMHNYPDTLTSRTWVDKVYKAYCAIERRKEQKELRAKRLSNRGGYHWYSEHNAYDEHGQ